MKWKSPQKGVNPKLMVTHFSKIFKSCFEKDHGAHTFAYPDGGGSRPDVSYQRDRPQAPFDVKTEKALQKRLLRFLDTPFPLLAAKQTLGNLRPQTFSTI